MWRCRFLCSTVLVILPLLYRSNDACFADSILGYRPRDPIMFVGISSRACCVMLDRKNDSNVIDFAWQEQETNLTLNFTCEENDTVISVIGEMDYNNNGDRAFCADITLLTKRFGICHCQILGKPKCVGSAFFQSFNPPPSKLETSCITKDLDTITCVIDNSPDSHNYHVKNVIKWKFIDDSNPSSQEFVKQCNHSSSCTLPRNDNLEFCLPDLHLNISVEAEYTLKSNDVEKMTASSGWITYDIKKNLQLNQMNAFVGEIKQRSLNITWEDLLYCPSFDGSPNVLIQINYTANNELNTFKSRDLLQQRFTVLHDLRPHTMYNVCLSARPTESSLWSELTCIKSMTSQDVPEIPPTLMHDAFSVPSASVIILYWQAVPEYEWNSVQANRRYVIQSYNAAVGWTDRVPSVAWTNISSSVKGVGSDRFLRIFSANRVGRSRNASTINIPGIDELVPGPKTIEVVHSKAAGQVNLTWGSDMPIDSSCVYWCVPAVTPFHLCQTTLHRKVVSSGGKLGGQYVIPMTDVKAANHMYGISLEQRGKGTVKYSGIQWQTCIKMLNGNSTSLKGQCTSISGGVKVGEEGFPMYGIVLIVVVGIGMTILSIVAFRRVRSHARKLREKMHTDDVLLESRNGNGGSDVSKSTEWPESGDTDNGWDGANKMFVADTNTAKAGGNTLGSSYSNEEGEGEKGDAYKHKVTKAEEQEGSLCKEGEESNIKSFHAKEEEGSLGKKGEESNIKSFHAKEEEEEGSLGKTGEEGSSVQGDSANGNYSKIYSHSLTLPVYEYEDPNKYAPTPRPSH